MKSLLLLLTLCFSVHAGVFYYGSGEAVNLENVIGYNKNGQKIISGESADPSVGGYVAEMGSLYMRNTGEVWIKTAIAPDTAWERTAIISDLVIDSIPVATYTTIQDYVDQTSNAGWISGGAITDNLDGTVDVAAGTGMIRDANDDNAPLLSFDWAASPGLALTDNSENYIYLDYNAGAPVIAVATTGSTVKDNENDAFELTEIYREGTELHTTPHRQKASNIGKYAQQYLYDAYGLQRTTGLILGETGTRNITTTAGTVWLKLDQSTIGAMDTSVADTFDRYYRDGVGGWTKQAAQTDWNNTQYDDGTGVLASLVVNRYSVQYFYIEADGGLSCLFGWNEYVSLAGAEADIPPSSLPNRLEDHAILIGRLIFQASGAVSTSIESAFAQTFGSTGVASHSDLANLTADDHINYPFVAGRSGGQTVYGSPDASEELTLAGSSNATPGFTHLEPAGGKVTIGTAVADDGNYLDIEETNAGNLRVRVRNLSPTGNTQFEVRNDVAGHNMAIGLLGSGIGVGVIAAGSPAIIAQTENAMNIMNDSNDPIRFLTDATDSMTLASTVKFQIGGDGTATFNFNNDDADFFIQKNTAGTAFQYNAALDFAQFNSGLGINAAPATDTIFDVVSTTEASRPCPTMTTIQRDAIASPAQSACVYNSDDTEWQQYIGVAWAAIGGGGSLPAFEDGKILASTASAAKWINDLEDYTVIKAFDAEDDLVANWTETNGTLTITSTSAVIGDDEYNWVVSSNPSSLLSANVAIDPALRGDSAVLSFPVKTTGPVTLEVLDITNTTVLFSDEIDVSTAGILRLSMTLASTTAEIAIEITTTSGTPTVQFNQAVFVSANLATSNDIIDSIGEVGFFTRTADFNGWISALDNSIGDATSGADYTGTDYKILYGHIWALAGLQTETTVGAAGPGFTLISPAGKGASADADWDAGYVILVDLTNEFLRASGADSAGTHVGDAVEEHNHYMSVNNTTDSGSSPSPSSNFLGNSAGASNNIYATTATSHFLDLTAITGVKGAVVDADETRPSNTILNPFIRYKNDTVAQSVSTGGGSSSGGDADTISLVRASELDIADIDITGNNADFDGGGAIDGTVSLSTTTADLILDTQVIKYVAGASSQDDYFGYAVAIPQGLRGRTLGFQYEYKNDITTLDNDFRFAIKLKDGSQAGSITYFDLPAYVPSDDNAQQSSHNTWIPSDCTEIEIGWQNTDTTSGIELMLDNVLVTSKPLPEVSLYNTSDMEAYTPALISVGVPTNVEFFWKRDGDMMEIVGSFNAGVPTAVAFELPLPNGETVASYVTSNKVLGEFVISVNTPSVLNMISTGGNSYINWSIGGTTSDGLTPAAGTNVLTGNGVSIHLRVPIEGWVSETSAVVHSSTGTENDFVTSIPSSGTTITSEGASSISAMSWAGNTVTLTLNTDQFTVTPGVQFTLNPTSYTASATTITATYAAPTAFNITVSSLGVDYKNPNAYAVVKVTQDTLQLIDGVTAPATAAFAQMYIDIADGDLKIKFSDGTVTVIATD